MPRSNDIFPTYRKLDLDKDTPPKNWSEGSRRCIICKKDWPNLPEFSPSPCCNAQAGVVADGSPDMLWAEAYSDLMHFRFDRVYEKWNEGKSDRQLLWLNAEPVSDEDIEEGLGRIDALLKETHDTTKI